MRNSEYIPFCLQAVDKVVRWGDLESEDEESEEEEEEEVRLTLHSLPVVAFPSFLILCIH